MHTNVFQGLERRWTRRAVLLAAAVVAAVPGVALATAQTRSFLRADTVSRPALVEFYDYAGATRHTWESAAAFTAGTMTGTTTAGDVVELAPTGPPGTVGPTGSPMWWDTDWAMRRCFSIDHTATAAATVTEYQIAVDFEAAPLIAGGYLQPDLGDLRAIADDGVTQLPLWMDGDGRTLWIKMDTIARGTTSHVCVYHHHSPANVPPLEINTEQAVFSYSEMKPVYYAVSGRYDAPGATVSVVSHTADNELARDGATTVTLPDAGSRATISSAGTTSASVFSVRGPISAHGSANGFETLVPISWAGTLFSVPTTRATQRFSFVAPFAEAHIEIFNGRATAPYASFIVPAGGSYTHDAGDIAGSSTAIITATTPVLVTHATTSGNDSLALYPATTEALFGVHSRTLRVGATADGTSLTVLRSDGTERTYSHDRGQTRVVGGGGSQGGNQRGGLRVTATQPVAAISQADGDGNESVVFLPASELGSEYWIPDNSQYIAVACPNAGTGIAIIIEPPNGPNRSMTCTSTGGANGDPGWAVNTGNINVNGTTGTRVYSPGGEPFFVYYEYRNGNDETNVLGAKQARQHTWPEPSVAAGPAEGLYRASGTWESASLDTGAGSEIFGTLDFVTTTPPGTALDFQVAASDLDPPMHFTGPDGTGNTWFNAADARRAVDFALDGSRYVRLRARFTTADRARSPGLVAVSVGYHLPLLARPLDGSGVVPLPGVVGTATTHYLLRITTTNPNLEGTRSRLGHLGGTGMTDLSGTLRLENVGLGIDSTQLAYSGAPPAPLSGPPVDFDAARPHSVVFDATPGTPVAIEIELRWTADHLGAGSIEIQSDVRVRLGAS